MEKNLVNVYQDTVRDIKRGYYENSFGEEIEFERTGESFYYTKVPKIEESYIGDKKTKITVENVDTLVKAIEMGPDAVILNMASDFIPGGGVEKGSRAQEEDICRRSNLIKSIYRYHPKLAKKFGMKYNPKFSYPLNNYSVIYSPKISIYKKPGTYEPYYEPFITNVITAPALKRPELTKDGNLKEKDAEIMKEKIKTVLRVALRNHHTKIVLGAWGCGAYGLPAENVAKLFKEVLSDKNFSGKFDEICFAIIEDKNSIKTSEGNFKTFLKYI